MLRCICLCAEALPLLRKRQIPAMQYTNPIDFVFRAAYRVYKQNAPPVCVREEQDPGDRGLKWRRSFNDFARTRGPSPARCRRCQLIDPRRKQYWRTSHQDHVRNDMLASGLSPKLGTFVQGFDPRPVIEHCDTPRLLEYQE